MSTFLELALGVGNYQYRSFCECLHNGPRTCALVSVMIFIIFMHHVRMLNSLPFLHLMCYYVISKYAIHSMHKQLHTPIYPLCINYVTHIPPTYVIIHTLDTTKVTYTLSTLAVASSMTRILFLFKSALAKHMSCLCPTLKLEPPSVRVESKPPGMTATTSFNCT